MIPKFIAGVAAIALSATALHADPGGGKGGGNGKGGGGQAHSQGSEQSPGGPNGGGNGKAQKGGGNGKAQKGGDNGGRAQQAQASRQEQAPRRDNGNGKAKSVDARGNAERQARKADRGTDAKGSRGNSDRGDKGAASAQDDRKPWKGDDARPGGDDRRDIRITGRDSGGEPFRWSSFDRREPLKGCPPGLAKKNNGCTPPGLATDRSREDDWGGYYDRPDWWGYDGYQGRYSYYDGSLLQLGSNGSILGFLPLLGGALAPGNLWPTTYDAVAVPDYYESYYNLGSDDSYRYYDDAFYSVDPQTQAISSITALLTGNDFSVGQPLPEGYDVYNVPYSYRDDYVDGPDADYRYSDGYIYEVDPTTQLIRTAIELLT